jgi:hypothetical protein
MLFEALEVVPWSMLYYPGDLLITHGSQVFKTPYLIT